MARQMSASFYSRAIPPPWDLMLKIVPICCCRQKEGEGYTGNPIGFAGKVSVVVIERSEGLSRVWLEEVFSFVKMETATWVQMLWEGWAVVLLPSFTGGNPSR